MLPRVGRGKEPGVFYNTGHGHLGWTLSAATARIVAESVAAELARAATHPGTRRSPRSGCSFPFHA